MEVDISRLRTLLKFEGVDTSSFTDEELEVIVETKLSELEGFINADIYPHERKFVSTNYNSNVVELDFYPLRSVDNVSVEDFELEESWYDVNTDLGIIYLCEDFFRTYHHSWYRGKWTHRKWHFKHHFKISIEYVTGLSDRDFQFLILPLLKDMVAYTLSFGKVNENLGGYGFLASNLHEGDVSVSFANGGNGAGSVDYGYSPSINSKINELVRRFRVSARVKLL